MYKSIEQESGLIIKTEKNSLIHFPGHVLVSASLSREGLRSSESAVHCGLTGQRTSKERYVRRPRIKKESLCTP